MICYIKDRKTFKTKGVYAIGEYDIVLASIFDDKSKINIVGIANAVEGDWAYCDNGFLGVIVDVKPQKNSNVTILTLREGLAFFDRDCDMTVFETSYEHTIKSLIESEFMGAYESPDPVYQYDYIYISQKTRTEGVMPPDWIAELYFYNGKEYIEKLRWMQGIFTTLSVTKINGKDRLKVEIERKDSSIKKVDFSSKEFSVLVEEYAADAVAKVTVQNTMPNPRTDYYLKKDGTVTTSRPNTDDRAQGIWKMIMINESDDPLQKARETFAKNKFTHMIEFSGPSGFNFFDNLKIRINGRVLTSYISSVRVTSESSRYIYKSGELRTKITDKIRGKI